MSYPKVIFYRHEKYSWIDNYLVEFQHKLTFTVYVSKIIDDLKNLYNYTNYNLFITFGNSKEEYVNDISINLPKRFIKKWIHYDKLPSFEILNDEITIKYVDNVIDKRINNRPEFSIFTSCFNSYEKILRAYNSIIKQTLTDWEWVIVDDSSDENHFNFIKEQLNDPRIRMYKRSSNSGCIGNVKNEAISLCRGKYVLELDHDDEIIEDLLLNAKEVFEKDKEIGFIYMDFINIYENKKNFMFEGCICKGYGSYYLQKYKNRWVFVYITPNINNITLSYLICCPNHPRIWRRDVLLKIENFSEELPICDDYEILLRTSINTKIAKIHKLGYVQYMNDNENNFSFIRNKEINRIGPEFIAPQFYEKYKIHDQMKILNAYEDPQYINNHSDIWKRCNDYEHKYCNLLINLDFDVQYCILGIKNLKKNLARITELYKNNRNDFIVLDSGVKNEILCEKIEALGFDKMKCYSLLNNSNAEMVNYFKLLYLSCNKYEIISAEDNEKFSSRHAVVNNYINKDDKYLEIGIEYGNTFLNINCDFKVGVDPDPKIEMTNIIKTTSEEYFINNIQVFDVIFIDGMHQVEYLVNDLNNSIRSISDNGKIFIDDVLPLSYEEQLKIPTNPKYENNILKYSDPWTGDIWKVIYFILNKFKNSFEYNVFIDDNYRGVIMLSEIDFFQILPEDIIEINEYDYYKDFENYKKMLCENI